MKIFSQNRKFILYINMCSIKYLSNCCPIYLFIYYSHHKQGDGAFWCRRQTTFHPIITYYLCPQKCDHLVCDEIMMVSKDVKHDSFAVNTFVDKA